MEVVFSVIGIEKLVGKTITRRVPTNYLEGFISLYMFPIYAIGLPFFFEPVLSLISSWHIFFRYILWCFSITAAEALLGFVCHKLLKFYPWDYYKLSPYKVFYEGYTLWNLIPFWGIAGLALEIYSSYLNYSSKYFLLFLEK
ncbi:MAG: hypothetical protein HN576_13630 [Bacteriovoracaceae bacterium]|nr:hypothetical protein [Bacteriovoracaceae bacterium]